MGVKDFSNEPVYSTRPYHAPFLSDDEGEDDDVCVWRDEPILSDLDDFDEEIPIRVGHVKKWTVKPKAESNDLVPKPRSAEKAVSSKSNPEAMSKTASKTGSKTPKTNPEAVSKTTHRTTSRTTSKTRHGEIENPSKQSEPSRHGKSSKHAQCPNPSREIKPKTAATAIPTPPTEPTADVQSTQDYLREREMQYALSTTRRNLTHISQFMLKLEARAGKVTKEGLRNTLDATVNDKNYDLAAPTDYAAELEELKHMSNNIYLRLYLVDRHWRRAARKAKRGADGRYPDIGILSEPAIREWTHTEIATSGLVAEDTCYFSARDLQSRRSFRDWMGYLRELCGFRDHPHDERKLVDLAWLFLDRNLRGPRPSNPTTAEQFIAELEARRRSGVWAELLENPLKQVEDDAEAWQTLARYWSSRPAPA
ncbi:hypothetical protein F4861DRAFT_404386 [Xylaria intraflava]|nr:hypothetical protein F4861DRAFT_404386 [Xylaria intraflava]